MFGFRYHVATLCAMFFMLGCGILIGLTSNVSPILSRQQSQTIKLLSGKLDNVSQEAERDHNLLQRQEDALTQMIPKLVGGKLAGKRIAIVRTGDYQSAVQSASDALTAAGATVVSTTTVTDKLQILDDKQRASIAQALNVTPGATSDQALYEILHPIAATLRVGDGERSDLQAAMNTLVQNGVIDTDGDFSQPVSAVVVVGGSTSNDDGDTEAAMLSALVAPAEFSTVNVVGCEPLDAASSSIGNFTNAGISTVDCIDLPVGALDLPFAVAGKGAVVDYGVKPTATSVIPQSLATLQVQTPAPGR